MILIADSGSTNTNWAKIDGKEIEYFQTSGINPFFRSSKEIYNDLKREIPKEIGEIISEIYFYGAGIVNVDKGAIVKKALLQLFPNSEIFTKSDLLAAAYATNGRNKGIACILGTGSNSCLYDGVKITEQIPPLGFILGDEGSGAVMGRKLLGDFLKSEMPKDISEKFKFQYNLIYTDILENVYKKEKPNKYLAQFIPFLKENIEAEYCNRLVVRSFEEFITRNILHYTDCYSMEISFVGSVAYYFQKQLMESLKKHNLKLGLILKEPMQGLVKYHSIKK